MNINDFGNITASVHRQRRVNIVGKLFTMEPYIVEKHGFRGDKLEDLERIYKKVRAENDPKAKVMDPIYGMGIQCDDRMMCELWVFRDILDNE